MHGRESDRDTRCVEVDHVLRYLAQEQEKSWPGGVQAIEFKSLEGGVGRKTENRSEFSIDYRLLDSILPSASDPEVLTGSLQSKCESAQMLRCRGAHDFAKKGIG